MVEREEHIRAYAERLAAVARHTFEATPNASEDTFVDGFVQALNRFMADGMSLDEAYQHIYARLAEGVADG